MVLEELISARTAEQTPQAVIPTTFIYSTLSLFIALWIFPSNAAIVAVFLISLAALPLILNIIWLEKGKECGSKNYIKDMIFSLVRNGGTGGQKDKLIYLFIFLFIGLALSIAFWYVVMPKNMIQDLFYVQLNTIKEVNTGLSASAVVDTFFSRILLNNLKVLAFAVLFSFMYGAGAVFVIAWNASVIGVAIGDSIKSALGSLATTTGAATFAGYTSIVSASLLRYMVHGVPEMLSYFIGALAGSMISIVVIKREYNSQTFRETASHILGLIGLAIAILVVAAIIEVTFSPVIIIKA